MIIRGRPYKSTGLLTMAVVAASVMTLHSYLAACGSRCQHAGKVASSSSSGFIVSSVMAYWIRLPLRTIISTNRRNSMTMETIIARTITKCSMLRTTRTRPSSAVLVPTSKRSTSTPFGGGGGWITCSTFFHQRHPPTLLIHSMDCRRPQRSMITSSSLSSSSDTTMTGNTTNEDVLSVEETNDSKDSVQALREARKAEKERQKAEKKAKEEAKRLAQMEADMVQIPQSVTYLSLQDQESYPFYGDLTRIMSRSRTGRNFSHVSDLENPNYPVGDTVWIRGRLHSIRVKGGSCFLVLRQDSFHTIQACYFKDKTNPDQSRAMIKYLESLTLESIIEIEGSIVEATVKSCSIQTRELKINRIYAVSKADTILPFLIEDAARNEKEVEDSQNTDRPFPRLGQELRLDHRWLDLRVPANNAIMRIQSAICQLFRESLYGQGFCEIHTPKLIAGESESGAGVFTTDYFGRTACLAQSPQLYKQMAISSDLNRVFEIGPVFRAEQSHTRRHLCEFTGLDIEMSIDDHYMETLEVIHTLFKHIFVGLETRWSKELEIIRQQYTSEPVQFTEEPCVIHWPEAMELLRKQGFDMGDELGDLSSAMELVLGQQIKAKYGTDFFMLDRYPSTIRPFYTMPAPDDARYSNSYDIFLRGQEICSGAQRCHDPDLLVQILTEKGIEAGEGLQSYIESFRHGVYPHAGAGIGLERVVFLYLGLDNVRKASMFPRDPNRCTP